MAAILKGRPVLGRLGAVARLGVPIAGTGKERMLERAKSLAWLRAPSVFKDILSRCRVVFTVYETTKEIIGLNLSDDVRLLNYVAYSERLDLEGNIVESQAEIYLLGIEDLGITLPDGSIEERDDWKDLIVSIRYKTDYSTDPPTETILLTFQITYTNAVVYLDDVEVFRSEAGAATPGILTILTFDLEGNLIS